MANTKQDKILNVPNKREQRQTRLNVPALRFPEFEGDWKTTMLGEIAEFSKGNGLSKDKLSENGTPCILYGELYTKYSSEIIEDVISCTATEEYNLVLSKVNDVIIPASGETAVDISTARCILKDGILLGGDLNIIRFEDGDGRFFSYQLNGVRKYDIARIAQGVSVVHLYGDKLKTLNVSFPALKEQTKIANLLSLLDERIATQRKIIEKLESLMMGIKKKLLSPNLLCDRIKLSQLGRLKNGYAFKSSLYTPNGQYNILTIANVSGERFISGVCNQIETLPDDIQEYQILSDNDILISLTGNVGRVSLNHGNNNLLNQRVGLFQLNDNNLHEFVYQVISAQTFENIMRHKAQGAAQMNIGKNDIESYEIPYTTNKILINKITNTLQRLEECVMVAHALAAQYKLQKQYLLQQMFI